MNNLSMVINQEQFQVDFKDFTDTELLSFLLDAKSDIFVKEIPLSQVLNSDAFELIDELSLSFDKVIKIRALQELIKRVKGNRTLNKVNSSRDVFNLFFDELKDKEQEHVFLLALDSSNNILDKSLLYIGTLNETIVHPREILRKLFKVAPARFILVHNHPSGDPQPSEKDKKITLRIKKIADLIKIPLLDHVIIGFNDYYSFKDSKLI